MTKEATFERLSRIPDVPAQTIDRPSHNPFEFPRSETSHVPLPGIMTQVTRLHSTSRFKNFMSKQEAPGSADCAHITNILLLRFDLERNVVRFNIEIRVAWARRLRRSRTHRGPLCSIGGPTAVVPCSQQLHRFSDYPQARSLLAGLLVVPGVKLESPLDKNRFPFFEVFAADLCQARPERYIDKGNFLLFFAIIRLGKAIDREAH